MPSFFQNLCRGLRLGTRQPVTSLVALLTLGLAIGAGTAVFSVVHAVLLVPLPVTDPDGLVLVTKQDARRHFAEFPIFRDELELWQGEAHGFEILAGMAPERLWSVRLQDGDEPATVEGTAVTGGFFTALGVGAVRGRSLLPADETGGPRTAVLSYGFWQRRYGGDSGILDRTVDLNGRPYRVVGIAPAGFDYPEGADLWFLLGDNPRAELVVIGRLRPGRSRTQAYHELSALSKRYAEGEPEHLQSTRLAVTPWTDSVVGSVRRPLWILLGAVLLLLTIASANLAHLKLIEARTRRHRLAVRAALGASRGRLVRQLLAEGAGLAVAGGLLGLGFAAVGVRALKALGPETLPRLGEVSLHPWVLAFSVGVTGIATLGFSVLPALRATGANPAVTLRGARMGAGSRGDTRLLEGLVVTEIALALVLLLGAGLLARTFFQHQRIDQGFDSEELLSVRLPLSPAEVGDVLAFHRRLIPEIESLPGVTGATPTLTRPLSGSAGFDTRLLAEGQSEASGATSPWINYEAALPGYLETLGVPLLEGRFFTAADREGSAEVVVVNAALARHFWPGESAVGKRLRFAMPEVSWITVVGVVGDTRYRELTTARLGVYFPFAQSPFQPRYLTVRVAGELGGVIPSLRERIRALAPGVPLDDITRVSDVLATGWARPRFNALLLGIFALMAALLAVLGVFGVMTSRVTQRLRELGIRAALGASPRRLRRWVLGRGMVLAGLGVLLGLGGGLALTRMLESLLFEVGPHDPETFLGAALAFLAVAFVALWAPARRASAVDPVQVLRW